MKQVLILSLALLLASCAVIDRVRGRPAEAAPASVAGFPGAAVAQSAEALDGTTEAEKTAALSAGAAGGTALGTVTVSLGSPAEQGFWLRSSLVTAPAKGRVVTDEGASIAVDLLPGSGAAQLSLPAFRALGLPLTGLPLVTVYSG
ncbi:hypothetical protein [Paragemmobacter straminiformis]|uniref:D-galactarate dehydratase n=1 Tax=Paragemmobacter straminiformis TaxID=2045119 RepID=A0A842IBH5_9RHOB|nr:hypothetical protein [Gemmobacter straminiformis]MBC2836763.1 hypothetical protein [Gemmobacter straminiformis]